MRGKVEKPFPALTSEEREAWLHALVAASAPKVTPGPDAACNQDFLYDEFGLPLGGGDFSLTDITPALPKS